MENFCIFKNEDKKGENHPDYKVSVKVGDKWENWGACWLKDGAKGKYFSCSKSKPKPESKPVEKIEYPKEDSSSLDIPF